jgi:hypothetical protein
MNPRRHTAATAPLAALVCAAGLGLVGCPDPPVDDDDSADAPSPPQITHLPVEDAQPEAEPVEVTCTVTDDTGVAQVTLYFRESSHQTWQYTLLFATADPDQYTGHVDPSAVTAAGVDYYIEAIDADDPASTVTSPRTAPAQHHTFGVKAVGGALPFVEDWEGGDLDELGWTRHADGGTEFPWDIDDEYTHSGTYAVRHTDGTFSAGMLEDWLVSPPLEFDGITEVAVSWSELSLNAPAMDSHRLYVSMGSPDPGHGDFELVAELDPPLLEADWASSALIDLTLFVDEGVGYVGFFYEGEYPADQWSIDDVYVGEPIARFELGEVGVYPLDFGPGDDFDLTATVTNISLVDSEPITASLVSGDPLLDLSDATEELGVIPAEGTLAITFDASSDPEHADNTYLDLTLRLADGEHTWDMPFELLLGDLSHARVDYDAVDSGAVSLTLGHGDLDAPDFQVSTAVADANQWSVDVTDQADHLPPDVDGKRWWLQVDNIGAADAAVSSFSIEWGDDVHVCEAAPALVPAGEVETLYIPSRPVLEVASVLTVPSPVLAGEAGVQLTIIVTNSGTVATAGAMDGTLESDHEHVSNVSAGSVSFAASAVEPGEYALNVSPFSFDVSADHLDGTDLSFTLWLDDGQDLFEVPVAVEVPL